MRGAEHLLVFAVFERFAKGPTSCGERGSSIAELLIGATLVIGAFQVVSNSVVSRARGLHAREEEHLALSACRNSLEAVRGLPFASLPELDGAGFDVPGANGQPGGLHPVAGDADGLPGRFAVTVDQTASGETLYLVRLIVDWAGVGGRSHFELKSLVAARKGP